MILRTRNAPFAAGVDEVALPYSARSARAVECDIDRAVRVLLARGWSATRIARELDVTPEVVAAARRERARPARKR